MKRTITAIFLFLAFTFTCQAHAYNVVKLNPAYVPNPIKGVPVSLGEIYVGVADADPTVVANQIDLYVQEEDGTITAVSQPVTLGAGGVPLYNGSPVSLLVDGNYSLAVLSSTGSQVYYIPSDQDVVKSYPSGISLDDAYACDLADAVAGIGVVDITTLKVDCDPIIPEGTTVTVTSNITLEIENGSIIDGVAGGGTETLDADHIICDEWNRWKGDNLTLTGEADLTPQNFGAEADGTTDDTAEMQAWGVYISQKTGHTYESFPSGSAYLLSDTTNIDKDDTTIAGWGAKFIADADVVLFDLNPGAIADGSVYHDNVWWFGGEFDNGEAGTKQGTAIQGHVLSNSGFLYGMIRNFKNAFTGAIKDNFRLQYGRFRNVAKLHYMPDFLTTLISQNITITNNQISSAVESFPAYYEGSFADVVIEQNAVALGSDAGGLFYGKTAGLAGQSYGLTIENNWPEQGVGIAAWVRLDDTGGTLDPLDGFKYLNNRSGASGGLVHLDLDSVSGIVDISGNTFPGSAKKAIVIDNLPSGTTAYIDKNDFSQTLSGGGTIWDITALNGAMVFVGQNYYIEDNEGARDINSNLLITYTDLRQKYILIPSASTIAIPSDASSVRISGVADINTITPTWCGHVVGLWFGAGVTATLKDGTGNIQLTADYSGASTFKQLYCDGTDWREVN